VCFLNAAKDRANSWIPHPPPIPAENQMTGALRLKKREATRPIPSPDMVYETVLKRASLKRWSALRTSWGV